MSVPDGTWERYVLPDWLNRLHQVFILCSFCDWMTSSDHAAYINHTWELRHANAVQFWYT